MAMGLARGRGQASREVPAVRAPAPRSGRAGASGTARTWGVLGLLATGEPQGLGMAVPVTSMHSLVGDPDRQSRVGQDCGIPGFLET